MHVVTFTRHKLIYLHLRYLVIQSAFKCRVKGHREGRLWEARDSLD